MTITRRDFLKETATVAGGVAAMQIATDNAEAQDRGKTPLPTRQLARIREKTSILGIGCAPLGSDHTSFAEAEKVINAALDMGITYVDVSPDYGNAEDKLKNVLKSRRDGLFLVTKVNPNKQDKKGVQEQIEESLKRMGTDHVDLVHIHNLGDFDMEKLATENGPIAGLKEARKRGLIRFLGTSGHMRPQRFVRAIETGDIDLTMNALNFADRNTYDFEGLVLPAARKHGTAVVAMKVLGGAVEWKYDGKTPATLAAYHEKAIRYALGLRGVCCAVIGFSTVEEVRQAVEVIRQYKPLPDAERLALLEKGKELGLARGLYYGPVTG